MLSFLLSQIDCPLSSVSPVKKLFPAFIGAGICLFFIRSGFFSLLFLVPLGVVAYMYPFKITWAALLFAVLGNSIFSVGTAAINKFPLSESLWDILYFSVTAAIFILIIAPPPFFSSRIPGVLRFLAGSCLGAIFFTGIFVHAASSQGFSSYVNSMINSLISMYSSSGADVVQNALLESLTAETVMGIIMAFMFRGGSLVSCIFLYFCCRQISLFIVRLWSRRRGVYFAGSRPLALFHVYPVVIWILSVSLLLVIVTRTLKLEIPEIVLWNILVLCAILYFAQGMGILQYLISRPRVSPFLRFALHVLFVILLFTPVINAVFLGLIVLLGIAENWIPLRVPKTYGPPSTPEAQ